MTVTTPPAGSRRTSTRAHTRMSTRARSAMRTAAALVALSVFAGPVLPAVASPAPEPSPTGSASPGTPSPGAQVPDAGSLSGELALVLSPVANGTVQPGEGLTVSISLDNGTPQPTDAAEVTLSLGSEPLRDRRALTAWLAGQGTTSPLATVGTASFAAVASGGRETTGIAVPADDPILGARAAGVYPLLASLPGPEGTLSATSVMIVPAAESTEVGIGVVVPITAPPTAGGLLTAEEIAELTGPNGALTDELDAVEGTASILAVDPAIPAAIRVLGTSAPAGATEWLARLEALPNSRFALQFGDADVVAQLESGLGRPLRPLSLQYAMTAADFPPSAAPSPSPSSSAAPADQSAFPTTAELLDIGGPARDAVFWPGTGTITPDTATMLGGVVVEERDSITLVDSASTAQGADGATVPGRAVAGETDLLVYDSDVSAALEEASTVEDNALRGEALTRATAYLAFAVAESAGGPVVVTVDRDDDRGRVALRTAITAATQAPGVVPLTLGGLTEKQPVGVEIASAEPEQVRADAASVLVADEAELSRFATVLDDMTLLTGPERAEILQLLGLGWMPDPASWQDAVDEHRVGTATTLDSVGILPPTPINLFSAGAPIPIWVRNDLPYPVNVVLYATPDDLRLDVAKATEAVAGPQSNTRVQVPVQARVGNGEVTVQLQLRSRTLEPIGDPQSVDVNVRADWEGIGLVVLGVLVGGFLVLGVIRTVLRIRRRSAEGTASDTEVTSDTESAETAETADDAETEGPR